MKGKVLELSKNHLTPVASKLFPVRGRPRSEECAVGLYSQYKTWVMNNLPDYMHLHRLKAEQQYLRHRPTVNIVMSVRACDTTSITESVNSVLGQVYENWSLSILVSSPGNSVAKLLTDFAKKHHNIKIYFVRKDELETDAINRLVKSVGGDYVAFFGQEDVLWPNALYEVVKALNDDHSRDLIYTDEDQIPDDRHDHVAPFLKPDWSPELLQSVNYTINLLVVRRSLYEKIGGLSSEFGEAYCWDLSFRLTQAATNIHHVSKILYSKRLHLDVDERHMQQTTKEERTVLKTHVKPSNGRIVFEKTGEVWVAARIPANEPLVSIIIPTKNQYRIFKKCIDSIYKRTLYTNFEVVVVDTGSTDRRVLWLYKQLNRRHKNLRIVNWHEQPFSYARSCNEGARHAKGEVLVMLNNDTEVVSTDWLDRLAAEVQLPGVGAVGPMLVYPDNVTVQHAGVGVGLGGVAANLLAGLNTEDSLTRSQHIMLHARRNVSALTGACMAIRKEVFVEMGGFDESFRITYNDVDLCLRLLVAGYRNIYIPDAKLVHHESRTLGTPDDVTSRDIEEFSTSKRKFTKRWDGYINHDPYISDSIDKTTARYDIKL